MVLFKDCRWQVQSLTCLIVLPLFLPAANPYPATDINLDVSEQVFSVVAAVSLAGLNPWLERAGAPKPVGQLWAQLRLLEPATLAPVEEFVRQHRQGTLSEDLSRYISLALVLGPAPEFEFLLAPEQLPPDVFEIREFRPLLKKFYTQANLHSLWQRHLPAYESEIIRLQPDVSLLLLRTRAYLRVLGESYFGRRYVVFLEWLVSPTLVSARNYGEDYFLVVNPTRSDLLAVVRHQYLRYLIDPLASKYAEAINEKADLHQLARHAPRLPQPYRENFLLFASKCLIQAVELRLDALPAAQAASRVKEFERDGYLLTHHFYQALARFEQVEPSIRFYFPELLADLDVAQEQVRLADIQFAPADKPQVEPATQLVLGPEPLLAEAERQLAAGNHETARMIFERVLTDYNAEEPRALYGLAIVASVQQDAARAKGYFQRTLQVAREPHILAWTHIYLGRIYDLEGDRERAVKEYQAALAVGTGSEKIQQAARRSLETPYGMRPGPPLPK